MNNGGPATPEYRSLSSMSLRDWFAGQALQGYLASWPNGGAALLGRAAVAARSCYELADAMLAERKNHG